MGRDPRPLKQKARELLASITKELPINRWVLIPKDLASLNHPCSLYRFCQNEMDQITMMMLLFAADVITLERDLLKCSLNNLHEFVASHKELSVDTAQWKTNKVGNEARTTHHFVARFGTSKARIQSFNEFQKAFDKVSHEGRVKSWRATPAERRKIDEIAVEKERAIQDIFASMMPLRITVEPLNASSQVAVVTPTESGQAESIETVILPSPTLDDQSKIPLDDEPSAVPNASPHIEPIENIIPNHEIRNLESLFAEVNNLDLLSESRPRRDGTGTIDLTSRIHYSSEMLMHAAYLYLLLEGDMKANKKPKYLVQLAILKLVAYDFGYSKIASTRSLEDWVFRLRRALIDGYPLHSILADDQRGTKLGKKHERIEKSHEAWLHYLYFFAMETITSRAAWDEFAVEMAKQSRRKERQDDYLQDNNLPIQDELDPTMFVDLSAYQLRDWFKAFGGVEKATVEKPILTEQRKLERVDWAADRLQQLQNDPDIVFCWLDEKWFYCRNRRKKCKILPFHSKQPPNKFKHKRLRVVSRRHPTKVMYMGVVARPNAEQNFDGKIDLLRVSTKGVYKKTTYLNSAFSDENEVNDAVIQTWQTLATNQMTCMELLDNIADHFDLDEDISDNLRIRYKQRGKWIEVDEDTKYADFKDKPDLILQVCRARGTEHEKDVTCDSDFMRKHVLSIGESIRNKMDWVDHHKTIYLIMDNAGGHGTKDAIAEYVQDLKDDHNIEIIWQVPRSPETNLLDLGVWNSLQSHVDKEHRGTKQATAVLARTIERTWRNYNGSIIFEKVYQRWEKVLALIIAGNGDNALVDEARGKTVVEELQNNNTIDANSTHDDNNPLAGHGDANSNGNAFP